MVEYQNREDIDKLLNLVDEIKYLIGYDENKVLATSDDVKSAINELNQILNDDYYNKTSIDRLNDDVVETIQSLDDELSSLLFRLGLTQLNSQNFNFAVITRNEDNVENIEFWILSNAFYDYDVNRFVKINTNYTSFGIQIQADGTYPNEAGLGYTDNTSIGIWRNPKASDVYKDITTYNYDDYDNLKHIGAKRISDNEWVEFGISSGWLNNFMVDSYGGITVGGAGFEIDGNGIFPYTRLTSSQYTDENGHTYALLGLLDNAYHPTLFGWNCDDNSTYSWFIGLRTPVLNNQKHNQDTEFCVMYNDTPYSSTDNHNLDVSKWHIVFRVNTSGMI